MKNALKLSSLLLLSPLFLAAQTSAARQEIEQINRTYAALTRLQTEVEYAMFATHGGSTVMDRQTGKLSRDGDNYLFEMSEVETLTTPQFTVTADHEDKELLIDKVRRSGPAASQFGLDLATVLAVCDTIILSEPAPGVRLIRMDLPLPDVERAEFRFEAATHLMQRVTLYYREAEEWEEGKPETKARLEIRYKRQDAQPVFSQNLFAVARFVAKKEEGGFTPVAAFKRYRFFDNTRF
jgi:hypothetical protein